MRVVGCFLEYDGKFLLLLRHSHKPHGNKWGLPAGKVEANESDEAAMIRELAEETGYQASEGELDYLGDYPFGQGNVFVVFRLQLSDPHKVRLEAHAHTAHKWVTPQEGFDLPNPIVHLRSILKTFGYVQDHNSN